MKKITALYAGTFDPLTNGHLDVIKRASGIFEKVIVAIAVNPSKQPVFTVKERLDMIKGATGKIGNVTVDHFEGLLVEYANKKKVSVIVRGLRALSDFEYEFQLSLTNKKLSPEINTVFLMPNEKYTYLNSSLVRELAFYNSSISEFVPPNVLKVLKNKFKKK